MSRGLHNNSPAAIALRVATAWMAGAALIRAGVHLGRGRET